MGQWWFFGLTSLVCLTSTPAQAAEAGATMPARCRALQAEARSAASVLSLPNVNVQAVRLPQTGDLTGENLTPGSGFQARIGASISAIDVLRGRSVLRTADAECEQWIAREELEEVLQQGSTYGQVDAMKAQLATLEAGLPRVRAVVEETRQRLARELVTVFEVEEIHLRSLHYEARLADLRHELTLLESQLPSHPTKPLADSLRRYEDATLAVNGEHSHLRKLTAWKLDFQAGAIPYPQTDWFGMVTLGYNLGGIRQPRAEAEAAEARREDLQTGASDFRSRVKRFVGAMRESAARLKDEHDVIEQRLTIYRERLSASHSESDRLRQMMASLELDQIELLARRTFVEHLLDTRMTMGRALE